MDESDSLPMPARQRVLRIRRRYNRWVANQTLEDYALRFTATGARRWSAARVANTALGAISFLALEAIGGAVTLAYGFDNAVAAILAVSLLIFVTGLPICYYAARYGVDIDLLTRGAGFGYIGSTITSLIYASFTFIFFALEAVILALALEMWLGLPLIPGYVLSAVVVIPLVTYGITVISRFQLWTQPLWVLLHLVPFVYLGVTRPESFGEWTRMEGLAPDAAGGLNLLAFGAATTVVASLVAQIGEQVDFLRFLPRYRKDRSLAWWVSLVSAGPGWILPGALKLLAGSYLTYLCVSAGVSMEKAAQPTEMYRLAFGMILDNPSVAVAVTGIFVVLSQLKINVTNAYAGSIAWSNFFSRLTHSHPGRVVWLVFNVAIALMLMVSGIYGALEQILGLYSVVAIAWVGALVADLAINKPLGLSPAHIEFKRAHLFDFNPVGTGAMFLAIAAAVLAYFGVLGETLRAFSAFVAFATALAMAPLIAWATGGRYYLARRSDLGAVPAEGLKCVICEHTFEAEDMALCPAYDGRICSLCCSLDARCHDICKPREARSSVQMAAFFRRLLPNWIAAPLTTRVGLLILGLVLSLLVVGLALSLVYTQTVHGGEGTSNSAVAEALWMTFLVFALVAGITSLLFMLTHESRRTALEEAERQTALLMHEIAAHRRTDAKLQAAKDAAEAANFAKSRYMVGISHEIRAPLNAISGYAQLLARDRDIPAHRRDAVNVIRQSAQHLAGLVEGLLDISRIEAGHLELSNDEVRLPDLLKQFVDMFRMQAKAKGLDFICALPANLPAVVHCDEKRLRQVLFNLLTNAVKYTNSGHVALRVRLRSEVAEFTVEDSGVGIPADDLQRVFEPFERGGDASRQAPGMGLGLTITRLLTEIMGGAVSVTSTVGVGSVFTVKLFLPEVPGAESRPRQAAPPVGYRGARYLIMVVDDEASHRGMMRDLLEPLGFEVVVAGDGETCKRMVAEIKPDLFLVDISMPGQSGWDLAEDLRRRGFTGTPIVMVSANANEYKPGGHLGDLHDAFVIKPVDISLLVETVGELLRLDWIREDDEGDTPEPAAQGGPPRLPGDAFEALADAVAIGHVRGVSAALDAMEAAYPEARPWTQGLRRFLADFSMTALAEAVGAARAVALPPDTGGGGNGRGNTHEEV